MSKEKLRWGICPSCGQVLKKREKRIFCKTCGYSMKRSIEHTAEKRIISLLEKESPLGPTQISARLGMNYSTVRSMLSWLKKMGKVVHDSYGRWRLK